MKSKMFDKFIWGQGPGVQLPTVPLPSYVCAIRCIWLDNNHYILCSRKICLFFPFLSNWNDLQLAVIHEGWNCIQRFSANIILCSSILRCRHRRRSVSTVGGHSTGPGGQDSPRSWSLFVNIKVKFAFRWKKFHEISSQYQFRNAICFHHKSTEY